MIQEYTFILCLDANCNGGETILNINNEYSYISKNTTIKYNSLLFRKDINHSCSIIKNGYKHILTMNLLAFNKHDNIVNNKNVIIIFDKSNDTDGDIKISENRNTFIIPLNKILSLSNTYLAKELSQNKLGNENIIYHNTNKNKKLFGIFSSIYYGKYITYNEFKKYKQDILQYGFNFENILIEYESTPMGNEIICSNKTVYKNHFDYTHKKRKREYDEIRLNKRIKLIKQFNINKLKESKNGIYLCDKMEEQSFILDAIKKDKLSFIPFKLIFCEGTSYYGGGCADADPLVYKLTPVWLSVGEIDNIVFIDPIGGFGKCRQNYRYS